MRHYPFAESFSHVLGYVGRINAKELNEIDPVNYSASHYIGKLGVEKYYEDELHGNVGYEEVENDASGKPIRTLKQIHGVPGKNLTLTIDSGLQIEAEKALLGNRGAIVAIEPGTGQILAMVSEPAYDPNLFVLGVSQKEYKELQESPDKPLYDRAIRGLYPLASTIKPYLALEGLQSGATTADFTIYDAGTFSLPNSSHVFHDWKKHGHGRVDVSRAIIVSCDIYFYQLAAKMGIRNMGSILSQFGFGNLTGVDLEGELPGNVPSPEWKMKHRGQRWYPGDTVITAIGQGDMQATPLQLASAVSTMATRGKRYIPYLLMREQLPGFQPIQHDPISLAPVTLKSDNYWDLVIDAMQEVVTTPSGTAYQVFGRKQNYTIAGKTGTAAVAKRRVANEEDKQDSMPEHLRDHRLFIAFAPIESPKLALAIVTEHSNNAIEAARTIFDYYLGSQSNGNRQPPKTQ
jgi:penicillin-binding protein 2